MMIAMLDAPRLRAGSISMKTALARVSDLKRDKPYIGIWSSTFLDQRSRAQLGRHVQPKADGGQGC